MNKFKKIMLGALSVLTLGLFVVTGAKVNATTISAKTETQSSMEKGGSYYLEVATVYDENWTGDAIAVGKSSVATFSAAEYYGPFEVSGSAYKYSHRNDFTSYGGYGLQGNNSSGGYVKFNLGYGMEADVSLYSYSTKTSETNTSTIAGEDWFSSSDFTATNTVVEKTKHLVSTASVNGVQEVEIFVNNKCGWVAINVEIAAESDKVQAKFNSNGGSEVSTIDVDSNNQFTFPSVTKTGFDFGGWYVSGAEDTLYAAGSTGTITATTTYIAKWINGVTFYPTDIFSSVSTNTAITDEMEIDGTLYTIYGAASNCQVEPSSTTIDNVSYSKRLKMPLTSIEVDSNNNKTGIVGAIGINIPSSKTYGARITLIGQSTNSSTPRQIAIFNSSYEEVAYGELLKGSVTLNVNAGGKYYLGTTSNNYQICKLIVEYNTEEETSTGLTLAINAQFNEAEAADSTKLRFIGTIEGLTYNEYAKIDSMEFVFTFNGTIRNCEVTKLYKSIKNGDDVLFEEKAGTMYVIYQLNNINKEAYKKKTISNIKFVVKYTDGSQTIVTKEDIGLPEFTTVIA